MTTDKLADLRQRFKYHPPGCPDIAIADNDIREGLHLSAQLVEELCPEGREKSLAITKIEEAMFWATAGIARKQKVGAE